MSPKPLSTIALLVFSLPMVAGGLMNMLVANVYLKYATDVLLLAPGLMGSIFLASRFWDALNDPLIGYLSDKSKFNMGRRRSFLLFSALPVAACFIGLWFVPTLLGPATWVTLVLFLFFTAMTALYVPHYSLAAELSHDQNQRNRIFAFRAVSENLGTFLAVPVVAYLSQVELAQGRAAAAIPIIAGFSFVSIVAATWFTREPAAEAATSISFWAACQMALQNRAARLVIAVSFCTQLAATALLSISLYYSDYVLYDAEMGTMIIAIFLIAATLSIPLWALAARRLLKARLCRDALAIASVLFCLVFFLADHKIIFFTVCGLLGIAAGSVLLFNPAMLADSIDQSGQGNKIEAFYFSLFTFFNKAAMGLAAVVIGLSLEFTGFKANSQQNPATLQTISTLFAFFPALCFAVAALLLQRYLNKRN